MMILKKDIITIINYDGTNINVIDEIGPFDKFQYGIHKLTSTYGHLQGRCG